MFTESSVDKKTAACSDEAVIERKAKKTVRNISYDRKCVEEDLEELSFTYHLAKKGKMLRW